jgi:hypothetical protein
MLSHFPNDMVDCRLSLFGHLLCPRMLNPEKTLHPPPDAKLSHQRQVFLFISFFVLCRRVKTRPSQSWAIGRVGEENPHSSSDSTTLALPRVQFCEGCVLARPHTSIQATADHIKDSFTDSLFNMRPAIHDGFLPVPFATPAWPIVPRNTSTISSLVP